MKLPGNLDLQHVGIILSATAALVTPLVTQWQAHQHIDMGLFVPDLVIYLGVVGAILKASPIPAVNETAVVKAVAQEIVK
jgi:hypothetical protein